MPGRACRRTGSGLPPRPDGLRGPLAARPRGPVPNRRAAAPAPGAAAGGETIIQWAAPPCQGAARHPLSRRGGQPCPAPQARTLHIRKGRAPALHPPCVFHM